MNKEEILKILELITEVYSKYDKGITTATLYHNGDEEVILDNRDITDIN